MFSSSRIKEGLLGRNRSRDVGDEVLRMGETTLESCFLSPNKNKINLFSEQFFIFFRFISIFRRELIFRSGTLIFVVFSLIFVVFSGFKFERDKLNFEIRNHKFSGEKQVYLLFVWT